MFLEVSPEGCPKLRPGLYRYDPADHTLETVVETAIHADLTTAALDQAVIKDAPATIVLTAAYDRTRRQYPEHGDRYVHMEAGHAAQNVHLVCESRELNTCPVGAFSDDDVGNVLSLPDRLDLLYLLPFGRRVDSVE